MSNIDVLRALVVDVVLGDEPCALVVDPGRDGSLDVEKFSQKIDDVQSLTGGV